MSLLTMTGALVVVVVSITSHEAAHGLVADFLGDPTARERGRLTLNPLPHIDPLFTILLPIGLLLIGSPFIFGGAKPVPVNVSRLRNPRRDWALVGAAGPVMNVLIAVILCGLLSIGIHLGYLDRSSPLTEILAIGIGMNILLAIFNLVPIPPLDGSRVVQYYLSPRGLLAYRRLEQFGLLVIVFLLLFVPAIETLLGLLVLSGVEIVTRLFGVWGAVEFVLKHLLFP